MKLNANHLPPRLIAFLGVTWLIFISVVMIGGEPVPVRWHWVVGAWYGLAMALIMTYVGAIAHLGPIEYRRRSTGRL